MRIISKQGRTRRVIKRTFSFFRTWFLHSIFKPPSKNPEDAFPVLMVNISIFILLPMIAWAIYSEVTMTDQEKAERNWENKVEECDGQRGDEYLYEFVNRCGLVVPKDTAAYEAIQRQKDRYE